MALQEGDHVRLQCERCFRPLGRFSLYHHHGEGPLLLGDAAGLIRGGGLRGPGARGHRKGRVWTSDWDRAQGVRYRYECRCGRTILLSTNRVERMAGAWRGPRFALGGGGEDAVFLV